MKDKIIQFWYSLPTLKFKWVNPFKLVKPDGREFEWYQFRKKYGFDERSLWHLDTHFEQYIYTLSKLNNEKKEIELQDFIDFFKQPERTPIIQWFYDRVKVYVEYCPLFIWDSDKLRNLNEQEMKVITDRYLELLQKRCSDPINNLTDEEIGFLYKYNRFGW